MSLCSKGDRFTLHKFGDTGYNSYSVNVIEDAVEAGCEFCMLVFQALTKTYIDQRKSEFGNGCYVHLAAIDSRDPYAYGEAKSEWF